MFTLPTGNNGKVSVGSVVAAIEKGLNAKYDPKNATARIMNVMAGDVRQAVSDIHNRGDIIWDSAREGEVLSFTVVCSRLGQTSYSVLPNSRRAVVPA